MGGFGGAPSAPEPQPVPEAPAKQATKSVSAGAQAAADAQRDRARKNRGLAASILTSRSGLASGNSADMNNDTLG